MFTKRILVPFLNAAIFALSFQAKAGSCSGVCRTCGQYATPCGWYACANGGQTQSDKITKLPSGTIRNSAMSDDDGCPDNYPPSQDKVPFTVEGVTYKTLPTTVAYTINICTCP
ncbi:MAG: hypothetical protein ACXVCY_01610 [Pseudobdellovibrionaceae bacterium]